MMNSLYVHKLYILIDLIKYFKLTTGSLGRVLFEELNR